MISTTAAPKRSWHLLARLIRSGRAMGILYCRSARERRRPGGGDDAVEDGQEVRLDHLVPAHAGGQPATGFDEGQTLRVVPRKAGENLPGHVDRVGALQFVALRLRHGQEGGDVAGIVELREEIRIRNART